MSRFLVILACHDELISGTVYVILTVTNIFETSTIHNGWSCFCSGYGETPNVNKEEKDQQRGESDSLEPKYSKATKLKVIKEEPVSEKEDDSKCKSNYHDEFFFFKTC